MSGVMTPYIVRQGDYLAKLAFLKGFDADEVWNDPKNEEIKKLRPDPNILAPGDILYVPEKKEGEGLPIEKGTENNYAATVPKVTFSVRLQNIEGSPITNTKYWVEGLGEVREGSTDADGKVFFEVPVIVREVLLYVDRDVVIRRFLIGDLDPHNETSGLRQRLAGCGFGLTRGLSPDDPACGQAAPNSDDIAPYVRSFQLSHGLEPTGEVDDATTTALRDAYGA